MLVVDQMRADYVQRFQRQWTGGLRRLVDEGAWFTAAAYPYATTVTCAGHATVATGAFPRTHGVFQNAWYGRAERRLVTCTEDPRVRSTGYGAALTFPGGPGESGARLRVPTLADLLREQRGARVATLSLKARSAIMLAGHGGNAVTWLDESLNAWQTSTAFSAIPEVAVQRFLRGNAIDLDFGRAWTPLMPLKAYTGLDRAAGEAPPPGWTSAFPHVLGGRDSADPDFRRQWTQSPFADAYLGRFAASIAESLPLGRNDATDLLGVGFSTPDLVGHSFGPGSHEVQDLYVRLDRAIGDLFDRLDRLAGRGQWVVALTGDHGSSGLPPAGRVNTQRLTEIAEAKIGKILGPARTGAYVARTNGNDVYFAPGVYDRLVASGSLGSVVKELERQPGIERVLQTDGLTSATVARDAKSKAAALSYVPGLSGDLVLWLKPGWTFSSTGAGHGTGNPDDQRVPILMMGRGIRPGRYDDPVTPADIAPTLAALCGITMPQAEGRVLSMAFQDQILKLHGFPFH